jgi:DNA-binding MarR family transcriptional regulator
MRDNTEALNRILELAFFLNEDATEDLATYGLTQSRTRVLWELAQAGPMTQRALADTIGVSARNITGLVDALVETGFVTREPHPTDRRAALVTLTERGTTTTDDLRRRHRELAHALFSDMPADRYDCFVDGLIETMSRLQRLSRSVTRPDGSS